MVFIVIKFFSEKCKSTLNINRMTFSLVSFGVSLVSVIKFGVNGFVSIFVNRYFIRGEIRSLLVSMSRIKASIRSLIMVVISGVA